MKSLAKGSALAVVIALMIVAVVSSRSSAASPPSTGQCSNHTLNGDYGVSGSGHLGATEVLLVGVVSFDGRGGLQLRDTVKIVGVPGGIPRNITGTYAVSRDCRATATFFAPAPFNVQVDLAAVLVDNGREIKFIQINPDGFFEGTAKTQ